MFHHLQFALPDLRARMCWATFAALCVATLIVMQACATPAQTGAWAVAGTAAVDAGLSSLVSNKAMDPNSASLFSQWAHLISDTLANLSGTPAKLQALQDTLTAKIQAVQDKVPTTADQAIVAGVAAAAGMAGTRATRGPARGALLAAAAKPA